jgi:hypothetical protein
MYERDTCGLLLRSLIHFGPILGFLPWMLEIQLCMTCGDSGVLCAAGSMIVSLKAHLGPTLPKRFKKY